MAGHHVRSHAKWSASASARNATCPGAIAMCSLVEARESEAAAWGTAAHEVVDACLKNLALAPELFEGQVKKVGRFEIEVDDEMIACCTDYLEHCYAEIEAEECRFWVEEPLPLDKLGPPMEAGGTGDLVLYRPRSRLLKVKDLKTGRGVFVDAKGSWQMRTYALGAVLAHPDLDIETVEVTIIQPRMERGDDGGIRSEQFHIADLYEWAGAMLAAIARAAAAETEFLKINGNRVLFDDWAEQWLQTGQCTFCDARALCPKFRNEALASIPKRAREWFETPGGERPPELSNAAMLLSAEELEHALDGLEMIESWAKAVREKAHNDAERGVVFDHWILVQKIGHRAWISEDAAAAKLAALRLDEEKLYKPRKLVSPAQAEKLLGAKRKGEIDGLWEKPIKGKNFVRKDKTDRPAIPGRTAEHFETPE